MTYTNLVCLALFLPLLSSIVSGLFSLKENNQTVTYISVLLLAISAIISCVLYYYIVLDHNIIHIELLRWIDVEGFKANWGIKIDNLSITMIAVVQIVSFAVHLYSLGYMKDDKNLNRFISYLSLFTFFMLILVSSSNLLQLFVGWEGVGLCSYLLIGFWYKKESANLAAVKAFIVNRIGDFAFMIGLIAIYVVFDTIYFDEIFAKLDQVKNLSVSLFNLKINYIDFICMALFIGCMGKSAQLGLHTWLPDAMEGPTPVSALIHAATMVTAGVFLVVRMSQLFELSPLTLSFMTIIGASTAIFAATIAITQNDVKRVIAYSTCSQLGYMFFVCGLSAYSAGLFHLVTHAFFKALLFLTAGNIIIASHHEQDMKKMDNLLTKLPVTFIFMLIGSLAIIGFPPFSGYYSKDAILEVALVSKNAGASYAYILGMITAFLTALYSARIIYLIFFNKNKKEDQASYLNNIIKFKLDEIPKSTIYSLIILVIGSLFVGYIGYNVLHIVEPNSNYFAGIIEVSKHNNPLYDIHYISFLEKIMPVIISIVGIILATSIYIYNKNIGLFFKNNFSYIYKLFRSKWFIDEIYNYLFIKTYYKLAKILGMFFDHIIISGTIKGLTKITYNFARGVNYVQTGFIYHYALILIVSMVLFLSFVIIKNFLVI